VQDLFDDLAIVDLSARHHETQRPAFAVDNRVDFRGSGTPADTDRLIFLPPLPARRTMSFHNGAIDQIQTVARYQRQLVENALPDATARPKVETIISRRVCIRPVDEFLIAASVASRSAGSGLPLRSAGGDQIDLY